MQTVSTVGAGIGGIATAIRLARKGYRVKVFEQQPNAGGKLNELRLSGFRFDAGPSLFTLPQLVDELIGSRDYSIFSYQKLELITRYFFPDGTVLDAWAEPERFAEEVSQKFNDKHTAVLRYLKESRELYELTANTFVYSPFPQLKNFFTLQSLKLAMNPKKLKAFETMHEVNCKHFSDHRTIQLFDRYATYNGSNPYLAPGTLTMIPHLEHNIGAYFPTAGMYAITTEMVKIAQNLGVEFEYNAHVDKVDIRNGRVVGIKVNGSSAESNYVVNNTDIFTAYKTLLHEVPLASRLAAQQPSSSALIFYFGVKGIHPKLDVHNILFTSDYYSEFKAMEQGSIFNDPTIYIFITSKRIAADAPDGHENWFVMINVPPNTGQDWDELRLKAREAILVKIKRMLGIDLASLIVAEDYLDPVRIEKRTGSFRGSLYGISSNNRMAAFNRHPNRSRNVKGLYFVGGSVHPGGGIPLCLASAKIVDTYFKPL
ncbi:MAG: 1-hydroxycarotenoid 3,4-desaturase CrtD [Tenuifilum sp.]|uniref:1-hydroxycarotenoid 3,4-desaturase CrtD n=1 Tax=Tenuifilum sp. TaxID=2760880 RepID=UPI001B51B8A8|nr:phytoene desaturase [Bacteroidales bacterium]HOK61590.1 phytoene desaturase family protein [Tenuifilum sp.]MBP9028336.1 phytoene desaturase [Bacteroidales bacterium]HOK86018.1 phytoene desaturase family protein [Tenuifilum sp.]HON70184.1 phytoene desaturase family protein [Tenuifilum sp.]